MVTNFKQWVLYSRVATQNPLYSLVTTKSNESWSMQFFPSKCIAIHWNYSFFFFNCTTKVEFTFKTTFRSHNCSSSFVTYSIVCHIDEPFPSISILNVKCTQLWILVKMWKTILPESNFNSLDVNMYSALTDNIIFISKMHIIFEVTSYLNWNYYFNPILHGTWLWSPPRIF